MSLYNHDCCVTKNENDIYLNVHVVVSESLFLCFEELHDRGNSNKRKHLTWALLIASLPLWQRTWRQEWYWNKVMEALH